MKVNVSFDSEEEKKTLYEYLQVSLAPQEELTDELFQAVADQVVKRYFQQFFMRGVKKLRREKNVSLDDLGKIFGPSVNGVPK